MSSDGETGQRPPRPVILLMPGQGAQHIRMGAGLYGRDATFTATMDECLACFDDAAGLRADWLAGQPRVAIDDARRAQPLLLSVDYALGRLVMSWGITPDALVGHSVGETAAAALAGVMSFADAALLTQRRVSRAIQTPRGGMLAVALSAAEVAEYLVSGVVVGAINAPRQTVLAGPEAPLLAVEERLRSRRHLFRRVPSPLAFHSPAVRAAVDPADLADVQLSPARLPLYSAYSVGRLTPGQATDPGFWIVHPVAPVRFWPTLDLVLSGGPSVVIEAGPGQGLVTIARRHPAVAGGASAAWGLLPDRPGGDDRDLKTLRATAARLRLEGYQSAAEG